MHLKGINNYCFLYVLSHVVSIATDNCTISMDDYNRCIIPKVQIPTSHSSFIPKIHCPTSHGGVIQKESTISNKNSDGQIKQKIILITSNEVSSTKKEYL